MVAAGFKQRIFILRRYYIQDTKCSGGPHLAGGPSGLTRVLDPSKGYMKSYKNSFCLFHLLKQKFSLISTTFPPLYVNARPLLSVQNEYTFKFSLKQHS